MQIREPDSTGDRQRRQRFFLHALVLLHEQAVQTTLVMAERYKVANPVV